MISKLLEQVLDTAQVERASGFNKSFDLLNQILQQYGEENIAERLYKDIPKEYSWELEADILGILIWSTSDNGHSIIQTIERWLLEQESLRKMQIALHLGIYPFNTFSQMKKVLTDISLKFPEVANQCHILVKSRKNFKEKE